MLRCNATEQELTAAGLDGVAHMGVVSASPRRLIAMRLRPAAVGVALITAITTAVLGARYAGVSSASRVDKVVDRHLTSRLGEHHLLIDNLVKIGSPIVVTALTVLLVATLLFRQWARAAVSAALAPAVASATTEWVLKPIVERTRGGSLSYPSGHTTGIFAVATVVVVLMLDGTSPRLPALARLLISVGALTVATTVAVASIASGHHYATDTIGGACVAFAIVLGLSLVVDAVADRRASR
jgi:membrane-associated phospholipid phosphatase